MCQLRARPYRRKFLRALKTAAGEFRERCGWLLREESRSGVRVAEVAPFPVFSTESPEEVEAVIRRAVGGERSALGELPCTAFADWQLRQRIECLRGEPPVSAQLIGSLDGLPAQVSGGTLKVKIGVMATEEEIRLLRDWIGRENHRGVALRLDANGGLGEKDFVAWLSFMAGEPGIAYMEQPLAVGQEARMLELAGDLAGRLALDESVVRSGDLLASIGAGWPGYWVVKPAVFGDPVTLLELSAGVRCRIVLSSVFETAVGRVALEHLSRVLGEGRLPEGFGTEGFMEDDGFGAQPGESVQALLDRCWERAGEGVDD